LRQPQNVLEMTDTERALGQEVQNAKTRLVAKASVDLQQFHILFHSYARNSILCQARKNGFLTSFMRAIFPSPKELDASG